MGQAAESAAAAAAAAAVATDGGSGGGQGPLGILGDPGMTPDLVVQVEGLPKSALELAAQQAKSEGEADASAEQGPWLFTLDFPSFFPVITHGKNRCARERHHTVVLQSVCNMV